MEKQVAKKKSPMRAERGYLIQQTYETLRNEILSQRLGPGVKLTAEHLATALNVSRTPVRQAMERLYQEGYVVQVPGRGFFVAELNAEEVQNLYDFRVALEVHAMSSAMDRGISKDHLDHLWTLQARYEEMVSDAAIVMRSDADHDFHTALAALAGNELIIKKLDEIFDRLTFRRRHDGYWYWTFKGARGPEAVAQHRQILQLIADGDKASAVECLRQHIVTAWENYRTFLEATQSAFPGMAQSRGRGSKKQG